MLKEDFMIPSGEGRMFIVKKGQILRVIDIDGPQAADTIIFNEHNMKESFSAWVTRQNSGNFNRAKILYSKLPAMNVMFRVMSERDDMFWLSPGRCNRFTYEQRGIKGHNNCQDILAELIKPYGMTAYDVPEVLNIFMNAIYQIDGTYEFTPAAKDKGDYVDLQAEMDCLVGISACPGKGSYNNYQPKSIGIQIFE